MKKFVSLCVAVFALAVCAVAQSSPAPSAFSTTNVSFNLSPITLPGAKTSLAGAETDVKLAVTTNNMIGPTTLVSSDYSFIGARYDHVFPQFSKWIQNISPTLNGYNFQLGATGSIGVVRTPASAGVNAEHWGERAGLFLNYAVSGTVGLAVESQWTNLPGYAHTTYSIAFGPNFHF